MGLRSWLRDLFARVLVARVFVIEGVRWRCVVGVEECGGRGKVCGERGGGECGRGGVGMLPDVCSKHVPASMVKVYMSCVVYLVLHRHLFWTTLTNYNSTGIYSQNITSSCGPTVCLLET